MHFAAPWLLLAFAAIPVVVLLHVLRIPGRRREVADLRLWQNVLRHIRPDAAERLKRFDPLLLLELAVVTLLVLALAQPVIPIERPRRHVGFILDLSAGMKTVEDGRTRWEQAVERIERIAGGLSPDDLVGFVAGPPFDFSGTGLTPAAFIEKLLDKRESGERVIAPSDVPIKPARLLETGLAALGKGPGAIFLVTDNPPGPPFDKRVRIITVGSTSRNVGIVAFAVTPAANDAHETFVRVRNFSNEKITRVMTVRSEGKQTAGITLDLAPNTSIEKVIPVRPTPGEPVVIVELDNVADGLRADDCAGTVLRSLTVVALGEKPDPAYARLFGGKVFENAVYVEPGTRAPTLPPDAMMIAQNVIPSTIARTIVLVNPPEGEMAGVKIGAGKTLASPRAPVAAGAKALLDQVNVEELNLDRYRPLTLPGTARPLLRIDGDVVAAEVTLAEGSIVILGFDPSSARWTFKPSFVVFWANVMKRALAGAGEGVCFRTGETVEIPVGPDGGMLHDYGPAADIELTSDPDGWARFEAKRAGVFRWTSDGKERHVAVNLLSETESDNRPAAVEGPSPEAPLPAAVGEKTLPLAGWLCLLAAVLAGAWWTVRR